MNDKVLGYCGLYCGGCGIYQASVKGEKTELEPGVFITCSGCNSDNTSPWCTDCNIKVCARDKGVRYCLECPSYPCDILNTFIQDPEYPYHLEVPDQMKCLQSIGQDKWETEMEKKYTCPSCKEKFNWFEGSCTKCSN